MTAGGKAASASAHRSVLCLVRLTRAMTRAHLTARALGGLTVSDPSDWVVPCLPLHVSEELYAPLLGPDGLSERRPFGYSSVPPRGGARTS